MKRLHKQPDWPESWQVAYIKDLEEIYGAITYHGYTYAYEVRLRKTLELLTEVIPVGARVLDIAAAQGNFSLKLAELGYDVTWNDLRDDLIGYVKLKHETGKITFAPGNVFDLSFPEPFDAVLITEIIEHVAHPDQFLAKVANLVKPGGFIVMTTPNGAYLRNTLPKFSDCPDPSVYESIQFKPDSDGHIFLLHPEEISLLADKAGLRVHKLELFTNPLTNGHMKSHLLLKVLPAALVRTIEQGTSQLPAFAKRKALVQIGARLQKPAR